MKNYYRIKFVLDAPMNVGSGISETTDKDILRNSNGQPYIPGSSLAGVYRSLFKKKDNGEDTEQVKNTFGFVDTSGSGKEIESKLKIYDANVEGTYHISKRDCVALDEYKTSVKGSKFDFEVLEKGATFVTYIEDDTDQNIGLQIISNWRKNGLIFGSKTTRGMGITKITQAKTVSFDLTEAEGIKNWLEFDMYKDESWQNIEKFLTVENSEKITLHLNLKQKSGISVRVYTTEVRKNEEDLQPDYQQLTMYDGNPVVPGTSWAGAFKHNMVSLDSNLETDIDSLFGLEDGKKKKSEVIFSESIIQNAKPKILSHNAIDRFTNGVKDSALFTEKYYYGGSCYLHITIPKDTKKELKQLLAASIMDLQNGILTVGGQGAIGKGLFTILTINGNKTFNYKSILKEMEVNA